MWGYDAARTGRAEMNLPEGLHLHWTRRLPEPRRAWRKQLDDGDKLEFDVAPSPVVMGDRVFVPLSANDTVAAYDVDTGEELWRYYADGPVRLAPAAWEGRVYAVSDDGHLHCLDAASGELLWKHDARPAGHLVLGNERIVSMWAVRGGPLVKDATVYFAAGVWPFLGTSVFALDAETGEEVWANTGHSTEHMEQPHARAYSFAGIAPQGYLAASGDRLVVSGGRAMPGLFDRETGELIHALQHGHRDWGGYRVRIEGDYYYDHGQRYRLGDGGHEGSGGPERWEAAERAEALEGQLDDRVFEAVAAQGRLFVVTRVGTLYCFGPEEREPAVHERAVQAPRPRGGAVGQRAEELLARSASREGYALFLGAGDGDLIEQIAVRSGLHVVAIEPDGAKVDSLRRRFDAAGLYGGRVALLPGDPAEVQYPKYVSSLVVMEDPSVLDSVPDAELLRTVYDRIRPYDGVAVLQTSADTMSAFQAALADFEPEAGSASLEGETVILAREAGLPGAGQWTHQYADSAQSVFSRDQLVRAPFGPIWFGGPTHDNILPRHAAGPRPQVASGRLTVLGVETLSARCVYTGREMWVREFPGIGHPFTNLELEEEWRQGEAVYMTNQPGASYIGSPYVTLPDGVYLRYQGHVHRLDPATGETVAEWPLPVRREEHNGDAPDWGHISVHGDHVVTTTNPHIWRGGDLGAWTEDRWDGTSSERLVVLDRHTGEVLWTRDAEIGFRHNAIVSGNGRLFVNDRLSDEALGMAERRGMEVADMPRLYALDMATGDVLWTSESEVFGTFFSYSEEHDILVEGSSRDGRRTLPDEPTRRMIARLGEDGGILWERSGPYSGPVILHGEKIISARPHPPHICLKTGDTLRREHPISKRSATWAYWRGYGCGTSNASEHLLLFRSGAAGFTDLKLGGGTGTLGGFRSGCTASMIAADGVLNAPDYTRTCTCAYQNQTSLGLIHMPEMEMWTGNQDIHQVRPPLHRLGVNIGAPGDRRAEDGTLWTPFPRAKAPSPVLPASPMLGSVEYDDAPVSVLAVSSSYSRYIFPSQRPEHTLDGDPRTWWLIRANRRGEFNDWIRYDLSEPAEISKVEAAWTGPKGTEFSIQTSLDGEEWTTVYGREGAGPGGEFDERDFVLRDHVRMGRGARRPDEVWGEYEFKPVRAQYVRLAFGEHGDESEDRRGRRVQKMLQITNVRIGGLDDPEAYALFRPTGVYRRHSLLVDGTNGLNWVAASGVRGVRRFRLPRVEGEDKPYTVTLHFAEPDGLQPGDRVFDIYVQGEPAAQGFDVAREADGPNRAVAKAFRGVLVDEALCIVFQPVPGSEHPPILSGVEMVREQ